MSQAIESGPAVSWPEELFDHRLVSPEQISTTADAALAEADASVDAACAAAEVDGATFADVVGRLDRAVGDLWAAYGRSAFMVRVHPDEAVRGAAHAADERMTTWRRSLALRDDVAAAVARYATTVDAARLEGEELRLLERWRRDLRRAGHDLSPEARDEIRAITARIVAVEAAFERNVDEWSDGIDLARDDLVGLPESYVAGLTSGSTPGTYRVSLEYPDYYPFMEGSPRRDLREALARKMASRAVEANRPLLEEVLELRRRQAAILGYPSWAHYRIEPKMARTPERVAAFHASLFRPLQDAGQDRLRGDVPSARGRHRGRRPAFLGRALLRPPDPDAGARRGRRRGLGVPDARGRLRRHAGALRGGLRPALRRGGRAAGVAPRGRALRGPGRGLG